MEGGRGGGYRGYIDPSRNTIRRNRRRYFAAQYAGGEGRERGGY